MLVHVAEIPSIQSPHPTAPTTAHTSPFKQRSLLARVPMATGPAYMNATVHHSKVRASISLSSPLFVAGQDVTGKMEMECRADSGVGIGLIMVELLAIQELNSRDHSASSTFLHTRRLFQGPGLPPSNAVAAFQTPGDPPLPQGHFPARRGITTFFFRFPLPLSSPSSISFASGLAKIRYEVRASVGVAHRGEKRVVTDNAEADIVQCEDMDGTAAEHVAVGENGKMYVQGRVIGGRIVSGRQGSFELRVRNHSSKKTTGLSLTLTRTLVLHNAATASRAPLQISDTLLSQNFRGPDYCVQPGSEGVANLSFDVPKLARVVKGGLREGADDDEGGRRRTEALFEINCVLGVKIGMGIGHKDVMFEMPVQLSHPASIPEPSLGTEPPHAPPVSDGYTIPPDAFHAHLNSRALSPNFEVPIPYFARSPGPVHVAAAAAASPTFTSPPTSSASPPVQYYHPSSPIPSIVHPASLHQHLFSPLPAMSPLSYYPNSHQAYYIPTPPVPLMPFAYPARPNSAGAGPIHNVSPAPGAFTGGLPGVDVVRPVSRAFRQRLRQLEADDVRVDSHSPPTESHVATDTGPEEGKGERASRISHHLRMSSRARSMSPKSHRFPVEPAGPPAAAAVAAPHATSPRHRDGPPLLSPRPMLSPRNSFVADGATNGVPDIHGTGRSGRVDFLERMVESAPGEEGKSVEEVLKDLERAETEKEMDKTLPKPPVPSGKGEVSKRQLGIPKASEVFKPQPRRAKVEAKVQAQPTKSVLRPSPMARPITPDGKKEGGGSSERGHGIAVSDGLLKPKFEQRHPSSGLDALEKRLLEEVGTRKPETPARPTVFQVGLLTTPSAPTPSVHPSVHHPAGSDSKVSSLPPESNSSAEPHANRSGSDATLTPTLTSPTSHKNTKPQKTMHAQDDHDQSSTKETDLSRGKVRVHEAIKLRKVAKNRVADWLAVQAGSTAPENEGHSSKDRPLKEIAIPEETVWDVGRTNDKALPKVRPPPLPPRNRPPKPVAKPVDLPSMGQNPKSPTGQAVQPAAHSPASMSPPRPNKPDFLHGKPLTKPILDTSVLPRSPSGAVVVSPKSPVMASPIRKLASPVDEGSPRSGAPGRRATGEPERPRFLAKPAAPQTKYDVRSARGGKGGITTSVVALWTSLAEDGDKNAAVVRPAKPVARTGATRPALLDVGKAKVMPAVTGPSPKPTSERASTSIPSTTTTTTEPRQAGIKSASVPAAVVPSHAKPHLSSTASLARPPAMVSSPTSPRFSPTVVKSGLEESSNKIPPVAAREMGFGQARLRDLINKYQQAAS